MADLSSAVRAFLQRMLGNSVVEDRRNEQETLQRMRLSFGSPGVSATGELNFSDASLVWPYLNVRSYGAKGDLATDDTAAIQAAITACPLYGRVFLPKGDYLLSDTLTLTKPITLFGAGRGASVLYALSTMGNTKDVIQLVPSGDGHYYQLFDFQIAPRSGTPCRHAIYLNGAGQAIKDFHIRNVIVNTLNSTSRAIYADGTGTSEGNPTIGTIEECTLQGGIEMAAGGDTLRILNNHMNGNGEALKVTFQSGASTLLFKGNNVSNLKGIYIGGPAVAAQIVENEIETTASFTGSNGAVIDLDGVTGSHAVDVMVCRNSIQVVNGITADCIRVNFADRTYIAGNRFGRGATTSVDVKVTSNAIDTMIGTNITPFGVPYASMVADSGTRTVFMTEFNGAVRCHNRVDIAAAASGVEFEWMRLGRPTDDQRYSSFKAKSSSGAGSYVSLYVHDGVSGTSQKGAMFWDGNGRTAFLTLPPIFANNAAALAGGITSGYIYRTGADPDVLCVVH